MLTAPSLGVRVAWLVFVSAEFFWNLLAVYNDRPLEEYGTHVHGVTMLRFSYLPMLLLLASCGDGDTPPPTPTPPPVMTALIKLEWGSIDASTVTWLGQVVPSGTASFVRAEPYAFEEGDTFTTSTYNIYSSTQSYRTDGLLLEVTYTRGDTLTFFTGLGVNAVFDLDALRDDVATHVVISETVYVEAARISEADWEMSLLAASIDASRTDNIPELAFLAQARETRYNSHDDQETIEANAAARYGEDAFFTAAEDLRRAVNQQLYVVVPSVLAVGETFDVTVMAFDLEGHEVDDFQADVTLSYEGAEVYLPSTVPFVTGQTSIVTLPEAGIALEAGYTRITATDPTGRFASGSIPVRLEEAPATRVFWGDLHTHSALSDGDFGDILPEDVYSFARDVGRLDFMALTDHDYRRPIPDWKWLRTMEAATEFYEPGRFVSFLGYEWSAEDMRYSDVISHKNVIYRQGEGPVYSAFDPRYNTPEKLWAALSLEPGSGEVLTIPHHPVRNLTVTAESPQYGGPGTDWRFHDPVLQPLLEVYSRWGISETNAPDNPRPVKASTDTGSGQYALSLGYRVGFMASSDTHDGTPGVSVLPARLTINVYPVGLVALMATDLSREALFDALSDKLCYGTSGSRRILMRFETSDGLRPGDEGTFTDAPSFALEVAGTTSLSLVEIVRTKPEGSEVIYSLSPDGWLFSTLARDETGAAGGAYYLRVTQTDQEMGWMGPIYLEAATP